MTTTHLNTQSYGLFFEQIVVLFKREKKPLNDLKSNKKNMKFAYNILFIMVTICVGTVGAEITEWDCSTTIGVFKRLTDCTIGAESEWLVLPCI